MKTCVACQKSFTTQWSMNRHSKLFCKKKEMTPTFHIQFSPTFDEMSLNVHGFPQCTTDAQVVLLEHKFSQFRTYVNNISNGLAIHIIAKFKYINRKNERLFETVKINTVSNENTASKDWYMEQVVKPIEKKMRKLEADGNAVVMYLCHLTGSIENQPPLDMSKYSETEVKINNYVYRMDQDCNLTFLREDEEEDMPGFRNT